MIAEKFEPNSKVIKKACDIVARNVSGDNQIYFFRAQYFCPQSDPLEKYLQEQTNKESAFSILSPETVPVGRIFEVCEEALTKEFPELSLGKADYVLIPTLTRLLCSWCPKNPTLFDPKGRPAKEYGLSKCNSDIALLVARDGSETPEEYMEIQMIRPKFYDTFWNLERNKKHLS